MIVSHIFASLEPLVNCLTNIWTSLKIRMPPLIMSNWLGGNLFVWQVLFLGETSPIGSNHLLLASSFLLYHRFLQIILPLPCIYLYVVEVLFYSLHLINNHYSVATWIDVAFGPRMHPYLFVSFSWSLPWQGVPGCSFKELLLFVACWDPAHIHTHLFPNHGF